MSQTKILLTRLAENNRRSNLEMLTILSDRIPNPWNFALEGYHFKTLGQILDHSYVVDINWMHHILACSREVVTTNLRVDLLEGTAAHFSRFEEYRIQRVDLDQQIVDFFQVVNEELIVESLTEGMDGRVVPWLPAIHLFTHQTHHRGQISNILDTLSIANDYSSIIRI